jgi:hypothetical protein
MQANYYYKCNICGVVCNLKYQMGYSKKHPIRYKCTCGITIKGEYQEGDGISIDNAKDTEECIPNFVVHSSGEFLTQTPYSVTEMKDTFVPTSFIFATQTMDYEKYRKEFTAIINYRDNRNSTVKAINELYEAGNVEVLKNVIINNYDPDEKIFPLHNEADCLRAVTMINQFQFLNYGDTTRKTTELFMSTFHSHMDECTNYFKFLSDLNRISEWKRKIYHICDQIYTKIDLLIPAVGIDYYYDRTPVFDGELSITTTSFEEVKQLYVDLYELICGLLILPIGLDNILLRNSYDTITKVDGLNIKDLSGISKMRNKGNIIKFLDMTSPFESLLYDCLDPDIRNSIGHFSYNSEEIANSHGQSIRFYSINDTSKYTDISLVEICYDIWNMYKCLGVFNELIHHIELQILSMTKGIYPSFITNANVRNNMHGFEHNKKKIYPNEPCPCGSGLKYKKCCGRNR